MALRFAQRHSNNERTELATRGGRKRRKESGRRARQQAALSALGEVGGGGYGGTRVTRRPLDGWGWRLAAGGKFSQLTLCPVAAASGHAVITRPGPDRGQRRGAARSHRTVLGLPGVVPHKHTHPPSLQQHHDTLYMLTVHSCGSWDGCSNDGNVK